MTTPHVVDSAAVRAYLLGLQQRIVDALQAEDGKPFISDGWTRAPGESNVAPQTPAASAPQGGAPGLGLRAAAPSPPARAGTASRIAASGIERPGAGLQGGGLSQLVEDGGLLERGGCNFSDVTGLTLPPSATQHRPELAGAPWQAMGLSLVMHPRNPYVPTVHMNVRMFAAFPDGRDATFWFGGGMDLTPYYGFEEDARHFHHVCQEALDAIDVKLYPRFKTWCDEYFFLKHRNEPRGIGGVFFDDFSELGFERSFATMRAVGDAFIKAYLPIVQRRRAMPYGERERDFQAYRRGRYVEFNLVWDRGTLFGLQSGGRTESILMSMPPIVKWRYDWKPEVGSEEARLYSDFLRPRDWLGDSAT